MEKLKSFPFMEKRKIYYIVTLVLIIASIATGLIRGYNFGIDFTGGTLMQIEMGKEVKRDKRYTFRSENRRKCYSRR